MTKASTVIIKRTERETTISIKNSSTLSTIDSLNVTVTHEGSGGNVKDSKETWEIWVTFLEMPWILTCPICKISFWWRFNENIPEDGVKWVVFDLSLITV